MRPLRPFLILLLLVNSALSAQVNPDQIYDSMVHTATIAPMNNPTETPIVYLSNYSNNYAALLVSFDDFKKEFQEYYYAIELVDSAWKPIEMNDFDYVNGFNQNKITQFSVSSIAATRYIHYQFTFPNNYCSPKLSGNYILKVYNGNNKQNLVFTKRFFVVEDLAAVSASIRPPFDGNYSKTHQKINVKVDVKNIPSFQNEALVVRVVQNNRYHDSKTVYTPSFIRGNLLEFNKETDLLFPGGNEYRWLDLQNLSLRSDRIASIENNATRISIHVKPDFARTELLYNSYKDLNGGFLISNTESLQNENQNDYAEVVFTYVPPSNIALLDKKIYLIGALTNNILDANSEMHFDTQLGVYQKKLLLKQGYYSYGYLSRDRMEPNDLDDFAETEVNYAETENEYKVFIYYHAPGARNDQIVGFTTINSAILPLF